MRPARRSGAAETDVPGLARADVHRRDRHGSLARDDYDHAGVSRASAEATGRRRNRRGGDLAVRLYESSMRRSCGPACARPVGLGAGWQMPLGPPCRGTCGRRAAGAAWRRRHPARRRARCASVFRWWAGRTCSARGTSPKGLPRRASAATLHEEASRPSGVARSRITADMRWLRTSGRATWSWCSGRQAAPSAPSLDCCCPARAGRCSPLRNAVPPVLPRSARQYAGSAHARVGREPGSTVR